VSLMDKLRKRIATRQQTTAEQYWSIVEQLAGGRLGDKDAEAALAQIEPLLVAMRKSPDDVDDDVACFAAALTCANAEREYEQHHAKAKALTVEARAITARAEAKQAEANQLLEEAATLQHRSGSEVWAANEKVRVTREARKRLTERGCTKFGDTFGGAE
jgi:hypothetical protein